ncbi:MULTISPECIES: NAD(P)/FAD-dependent oxidoreductase [unclassified Lysinibacillus]|uniref:NAD(P)/FAD-dependent oxidoreductase n=1 Tax=unclassified Lysinibacillus TaxID=2636778 RepID=UPI0011665DBE|nr:NAD(P)/FAD-dependent oxidoreductase [Lysinibacillus sp. CD3-6]QPQ36774.1 NAD(P)/FAD-dependent oxidoreductase [Lysinibacillus sp. JNUCC-52]UED81491.1 NAD(P)/FAD-dependent oxidoreductase [Lysinibacillus sp. CD3-6]
MNILDCIIIGGGPSGLSASLTLGRARRNIALFDNSTNRNSVTQASHGFITRDGIKPQAFKETALKELENYPTVSYFTATVNEIIKDFGNERFIVKTSNSEEFVSEKIILATGIQEIFTIPSIRRFYGKSLFSCPYCDGWEQKDKPLVVIAEKEEHVLHLTKLVYNWSQDLVVLTNGAQLSKEGTMELQKHNIKMISEKIKDLIGNDGYLQKIEFETGATIRRTGGFVAPSYYRPNHFAERLGCDIHEDGKVITDGVGRTTQKNVYIAGETERSKPSSLMISAAKGNKAGVSVNTDLTMERF